jgi:hypothetical protein
MRLQNEALEILSSFGVICEYFAFWYVTKVMLSKNLLGVNWVNVVES